ncbi:MFS family permease [Frigoribacterium sp. PvP120]|uniref:MFS transporter n=1 Tax=unclassified Frigoribacterium TaxID=2627005 RepID=UPI001B60E1B6|nr:MFS transporter [Frigoribacterium sp. PvP121]MBP1240165.1 MFS family permease [Frigoribacterium sp. PvP121]
MLPSPSLTRGRLRAGDAPPQLADAWIALAGLSAVFLFEMLDTSVLNVALPTIGRELGSSTTGLQWVSGAYAVAFGGLMLLFGAVADRVGRRRVMLAGLVLLAVASLATAAVTTTEQLIAVRVLTGVAAAMTTPGSMALAFRLFDDEGLRVRALTVISTAGLVGLAVGPTVGGFVLAVAPWQVLLLADAPIAVLAFVGVLVGVARDDAAGLRGDPVDVGGALLGTATVAGLLVTPTVLVGPATASSWGWAAVALTVACGAGFVVRLRTARHPVVDLHLLARPLVSSGLAFKAASGLAVAGLSYLVTLQLQFAWGWPPALAAVGTLPQVVVLLAGGRLVGPFVQRVGLGRAAWVSAAAVVSGLTVFGALSRHGYVWVLVALVLVAAGMRVVGVVAGASVLTGLPADRTSVGAALVDTSSELAGGAAVAAAGTIVAAFVTGSITTTPWTPPRLAGFEDALTVAGLGLAAVAAALVVVGMLRARAADPAPDATTAPAPSTPLTPTAPTTQEPSRA